ncbi:MAG: outer membrane protein assembly factor BamE [Sterolibacterium sp.]|jgi:outer membrane protein assembly factor BamE|nr:outer membrane protein assembly factor BamE [Sterolibacterium sp.]
MNRSIFALPLLVVLTACSSTPEISSLLTPYRIDVRQGNYVTQEMVTQLKTGQSRDQVRFILGTPLVADPFHAERWDYVYRFQPGHGEAQQRRITIFFSDDKLSRIAGDVMGKETAITQGVVEIEPVEKTGMKVESGMTLPAKQ